MKKLACTFLTFAMIFSLTACGGGDVTTNSKEVNSSSKVTKENMDKKEYNSVDLQEFFNIKNSIIEDVFTLKGITNKEASFYAEGEFDLNKDGKRDTIILKLNYEESSSIIINNSEINEHFENPSSVHLVDLIKEDAFIEIAILDEGASLDPYTSFYRYNGENIEKISGGFHTDITSEDVVNTYYGQVLTDGKGRFVAPEDIVQFVSPNIIKAYRSLKDNKFIYTPIDYNKALNKEYTITCDFDAFFRKQDMGENTSKEDVDRNWGKDGKKFHKGDIIKIKSISKPVNPSGWHEVEGEDGSKIKLDPFTVYGVQLEDGTIGELYFWMGD